MLIHYVSRAFALHSEHLPLTSSETPTSLCLQGFCLLWAIDGNSSLLHVINLCGSVETQEPAESLGGLRGPRCGIPSKLPVEADGAIVPWETLLQSLVPSPVFVCFSHQLSFTAPCFLFFSCWSYVCFICCEYVIGLATVWAHSLRILYSLRISHHMFWIYPPPFPFHPTLYCFFFPIKVNLCYLDILAFLQSLGILWRATYQGLFLEKTEPRYPSS